MCISSSTYDETTRSIELARLSNPQNASEQVSIQSATSSATLRLVDDRDIHPQCNISESDPDSFDEMPSPPQGNLSDPLRIMEPNSAHCERASEITAQTPSSPSSYASQSATSDSLPGVPGMITRPGRPQVETRPFRGVQSGYSNLWVSPTAMITDAVVSDRASFNDVPRPDARDAWANSTWMESAYFPADRSLANDIPRPDASDAWASLTSMESAYFPSDRSLGTNIPQPDASDAWANLTWMESAYFPSDRSLANDIPQPRASGACANSYAPIPGSTSLDSHTGNVPHPKASGALDSVLVSNLSSTSTSQPNSNPALWTDMAEMIPIERPTESLRAREIVQFPITGTHGLSPSSLQPDRFRDGAESRQYSRAIVTVN